MKNTLTKEQINKLNNRPNCSVPGCEKPAVHIVGKTKANYPTWRKSKWIKELHPDADDNYCCNKSHNGNTARVHGLSSSRELTAMRAGFDNVIDYQNSMHPYLKHRKKYCENIDGRLGFTCNTTMPPLEVFALVGLNHWKPHNLLEVDHIDGNHKHNDISNLQTLCKHCHVIKTYTSKDHATPGRKTR